MDTNRRITIAVSVLVLLGVVLSYYYYSKNKEAPAFDAASQGVLPSIDGAANPLANKPDITPTSKTNPFDAIKTNPFQ